VARRSVGSLSRAAVECDRYAQAHILELVGNTLASSVVGKAWSGDVAVLKTVTGTVVCNGVVCNLRTGATAFR
jgi:hypothetical protein